MACKCTNCKCSKQPTKEKTKLFTEEVYSEDTVLRHFDLAVPDHSFKWHAEDKDHWLESLNENDWSFQFDNELPVSLEPGKIIQIPAGTIHKLIKGNSPLSISIKS
jgi:hypothetical protein